LNEKLLEQSEIDQLFQCLTENCDSVSYAYFVAKIKCYKDFQRIADLLKHIKNSISTETNTIWISENVRSFLYSLNTDLANLGKCNFETLEKVNIHFLPTGTYQEMAISNGWGKEYIKMSSEFDRIYKRLKNNDKTNFRSILKKLF